MFPSFWTGFFFPLHTDQSINVFFFFFSYLNLYFAISPWCFYVGTTCATILTKAIFTEGCKSVAAGMNAMDLRRGITMAVDSVVTNLKSRAKMISTSEEIAQVAFFLKKYCSTWRSVLLDIRCSSTVQFCSSAHFLYYFIFKNWNWKLNMFLRIVHMMETSTMSVLSF